MASRRHGEWVVPALAALLALTYWWQVRGQDRVVVLLPNVLVLLVLLLAVVVVWREAVQTRSGPDDGRKGALSLAGVRQRLGAWIADHRRELSLVALSVAYYVLFERLGFHLANLLFLTLAFLAMGLDWRRTAGYAVGVSFVVYVSAYLLQLNVPPAPWTR